MCKMKGCRLAVYQSKYLLDNYTSQITHKNPLSERDRVFELSRRKMRILNYIHKTNWELEKLFPSPQSILRGDN